MGWGGLGWVAMTRMAAVAGGRVGWGGGWDSVHAHEHMPIFETVMMQLLHSTLEVPPPAPPPNARI